MDLSRTLALSIPPSFCRGATLNTLPLTTHVPSACKLALLHGRFTFQQDSALHMSLFCILIFYRHTASKTNCNTFIKFVKSGLIPQETIKKKVGQ